MSSEEKCTVSPSRVRAALEEHERRSADATVHEHRLNQIEGTINDIRLALKGINESLLTLTRLEERHAETRNGLGRAHDRINTVEGRVGSLELAMPVLKLTSQWVKAGVIGIVALVGLAGIKLVAGV